MMSPDLDADLAAADPLRSLDPATQNAAVRGLGRAIAQGADATPQGPAVRRTRRTVAAIGLVAVLAAGGSAAAASGFTARTGTFGIGGEAGTGEFIQNDAPDFAQVVEEIGKDIPLPPGGSFDRFIVSASSDRPYVQSEGGIRSTLAYNAACQWSTFWLDRQAVGDETGMQTAAEELRDVPSWPGIEAADGDGGTAAMWVRVAAAAEAGDAEAMRRSGYTVNCVEG